MCADKGMRTLTGANRGNLVKEILDLHHDDLVLPYGWSEEVLTVKVKQQLNDILFTCIGKS
jgi:hypothetical protein